MGNAVIALAGDIQLLHPNPAGLAFLSSNTLTSYHNRRFKALSQTGVDYLSPRFGLSARNLSSGSIPIRDSSGAKIGEFTFENLDLTMGLGKPLRNWGIGFTSRVFLLDSLSSMPGFSLSAGILHKEGSIRWGLVAENVAGSIISLTKERNSQLPELHLGVAFVGKKIKLDMDLMNLFPPGRPPYPVVQTGFETRWLEPFILRAGINSRLQSSLGMSLEFKNVRLDYAYRFHDYLSPSHLLSFTFHPASLTPR